MKRIRKVCLALLLLVSMIVPIFPLESYQAAGIYENAKEFYDFTDLESKHHTMVEGGNFYIGTSAKLASSSTNLKYYTLDFIPLSRYNRGGG